MTRARRLLAALRRLLKPPRRFPPTREGWWFLVATVLVGGAAINSGFNLLFLVWGMMLCFILASGVMSELCLRGLEVTRSPPAALYAEEPYLMGLAVRNTKRRLPSFSVEIEDLVGERPVDKRCYFLKLPPGRRQQTAYRNSQPRRGLLHLSGFRVSTRFPFGLIRKSRDVDAPIDLLVYPALRPPPPRLLEGAPATFGNQPSMRRSRRGEFAGLREFRQGDDPRDIHWRTSARRGRPFVRESEDETGRTAVLLLDDRIDRGRFSSAAEAERAYEAAVSLAASIAIDLLKRGFSLALGASSGAIPAGEGAPQRAAVLRFLALVAPGVDGAVPVDPGGSGIRIRVRPGSDRPEIAAGRAAAPEARA